MKMPVPMMRPFAREQYFHIDDHVAKQKNRQIDPAAQQ
jgi:hypothetical protein